jgi:hypothetical protein
MPFSTTQSKRDTLLVKSDSPADAHAIPRSTIKMQGWCHVCNDDSADSRDFVNRWCTLENGYIWFFESPEDNELPTGQNKPVTMISTTKSIIEQGCTIEDANASGFDFIFTIGCKFCLHYLC